MATVKLSVVVAASNNTQALERCLESLKGQGEAEDTEIIVVSNYRERVQERIERRFPYVKYVSLPEDTTVPELRTTGIFHSRGEIVALIEDHCLLDENWCSEIKKAHELPYPIIGGSVENASCERWLDWAVYFYEYGKYMPPNQAGLVDCLPGNNVTYKRPVLEKVETIFQKGFFETFIHWELKTQGYPLYMIPSAIVYHKKQYKIKGALTQCYHSGRSFGGMRTSKAMLLKRIGLILGSWMLPILLPSRIVFRTVRKKRHIRELVLSLPYLLLLMASWSYGEFCGYACGEGDSSTRWR